MEWFAGLPYATVTIPAFSAYWVLLGYLIPIGIWLIYRKGFFNRDEFADWKIIDEDSALYPNEPLSFNPNVKNSEKTKSEDTPVFFT